MKIKLDFLLFHRLYEGFNTFQFTVPLNDIGTSTLGQKEKAIMLMRWISKAIDNKEFVLISHTKFD